ncbi:unnamed protein product [Moneuplotes crassus]|uniref:Uncharacterized protein n=1 Tax=Euplotes crassus TaxID=5936 RepID=A0AAD1XLQ5_EUPCR|nr:unnamed protein product [Moneuplotes crassus]
MFNIKSLFATITGLGKDQDQPMLENKSELEQLQEIPSERGRGRKNVINRSNIRRRDTVTGQKKRCLSASDNNNTFTSKFIEKYNGGDNCQFLATKQLPRGFADEVLDLEMQVEANSFDLSNVNRLIFLYSQAIEVYEGKDQTRYQNYYKKLQNLVNKPSVHQEMKSNPTERKKKSLQKKESKDQNKCIIKNYDKTEQERSKLIENDIRSQSFSLEKRLAQRRFSQNKGVLQKSSSHSTLTNSSSIGTKEDSSEEYSSILNTSKMENSWNLESKMLLSNLQQVNISAQNVYNFSSEEIIFEEAENEVS